MSSRRDRPDRSPCGPPPAAESDPTAAILSEPTPSAQDPTGPALPGPPPSPAARPVFSAGELLADRYRVIRLIARGGMGEVYEAEDEALRERVALKTIAGAAAAMDEAVERFKREIQLARRVTHPNVCRIFELGFHRGAGEGQTVFLTMELLEGETLAQRIRRRGRLTPAEALPLARQLVAGLAAAHAAGIVHRDFKSANVMLAPTAQAGGVRAVVTDFGIAHALGGPLERAAFLGSPGYMAPEQVDGRGVSTSSDVYALGVVLFEMVTGRVPFEGQGAADVALKRLREEAPSPRTFVPDLEERWEEVILRCLARDPRLRFQSVGEALAALDAPAAPAIARRRRPGRWAALAAFVAVAMAVALALRGPRRSAPPAALPPRVAVLGLHGAGAASPDWLSITFAEALAAALRGSSALRVVAPADVERMKLELALADSGSYTRESLLRIHRHLAADLVVAGTYAGPEDDLQLDVALQSARSGGTVARVAWSGRPQAVVEAAARVAAELIAGAAGPAAAAASHERERRAAASAAVPRGPQAMKPYAEGLYRLRRYDLAGARERLVEATAREPAFPGAQAALAEVWSALEDQPRARDAAARAHELALRAGHPDAEQMAARAREAEGAWAEAAAIYRRLLSRPGQEVGLRLVQAHINAGQPAAARTVIDELRSRPEAERDDLRIGLLEAALTWTSDPERAEAALQRVIREARAREARALLAEALARRAEAAWVRGDFRLMADSVEEARKLHALLGDRRALANDLSLLGAVRYQQGRSAESARLAAEAAAIYRELGHAEQTAVNVGNQGYVRIRLAQLPAAGAVLREALRMRPAGDAGRAHPLVGLGWRAAVEGRLEEAERLYREAGPPADRMPEPYVRGFLAARLAELLIERDELEAARRTIEDGLALMSRTGVKLMVAELRLVQAALLLAEGRLAEAEAMAQATLDEVRRLEAADLESQAHLLVARSALGRGDVASALAAAQEAARGLTAHDNRLVAIGARTTRAQVGCQGADEGGAAEAALGELGRVAAEADGLGLVALSLRAHLALASCETHVGRTGQAARRLAAVQGRASRTGHRLVAREARRARGPL